MDGSSSRLSKRHLSHRFTALASTNPNCINLLAPYANNGFITYLSLKQAAQALGEAKAVLQSPLAIATLGQWIKKPMEQDTFEILFNVDKVN